jgi:hypothetical protein
MVYLAFGVIQSSSKAFKKEGFFTGNLRNHSNHGQWGVDTLPSEEAKYNKHVQLFVFDILQCG